MKYLRSLFIFVFLLLSFNSVFAASSLQLHLAPVTRLVLPNGLTLLIRERHETGNVSIHVMVGAGQLTEEEGQMGITNLLQNYLLETPAEGYHDAATAVEAQGGVISAGSGPDSADFQVTVPKQAFAFSTQVLADLIHTKKIDSKIFATVKTDTLEEVKQSSQESYQALYSIFLQEFYSFHPYRVPVVGLTNTVKSLKELDILNYMQRYYTPNNMVIAVVGNVDSDRVIQLVNKCFSDLEKKLIPSKNIYFQPILDDSKEIDLQESGNLAWLFVGFSAPELKNQDYATMQLVNSVLGAGLSSRIWLSIREKHGLSYELGSQYSVREGPSHFIIYVTTSPENLRESKDNLLKEIDRIRKEPLTSEELEIIKRRMTGQFILSLETNSSQAQFLAWSELTGKGIMFDENYLDLIQGVTSADILRVSKKYLQDYILISVE